MKVAVLLTAVGVVLVAAGLWLLTPAAALIGVGGVLAGVGLWMPVDERDRDRQQARR